VEEARSLLGFAPSLESSGYLRKSSIEHASAVLGSPSPWELTGKALAERLSEVTAALETPPTFLSMRAHARVQLGVEALRKAVEHFNVDEVHGQVFSFCFYDDKCIDKKLLDHQGRNKDEMAPFLIIDSTREVLQSTVKPNRKDSIAIQLAIRWQVPSKRGLPDGSWKGVYWREIVAAAEMHFTVETAQYLIDQADEAAWRTRARYDGRTLSSTSSQTQSQPARLPTIKETEPDENSMSPTSVGDALLMGKGATGEGSIVQSEIPKVYEGFPDFEERVKELMGALVKDNIHRLRIWITGIDAQLEGIPKPRMVEEAFSLMNSLTNVDGLQAVKDPTHPDAQAFLAGPKVVEGDFDHVFEHICDEASLSSGKECQFISSESELRAKRRLKGKSNSRVILLYKLTVTLMVGSVAVSLDVEGSGPMIIKQMDRFAGDRRHTQADDTASTCEAETSSIHTYYSEEVESRYLETFRAQTSQTSSNNSLPDRSIFSIPGDT
jgi:hypothetical protein